MTANREIDLRVPSAYRNGLPLDDFDWLRENAPVYWHHDDDSGFWALTRHRDVLQVARDSQTFSAEPTTMLNDADTLGDADHKHLMFRDPPSHSAHRKTLVADFLPSAARLMRPRVDELTNEIIDAVADRDTCDLVTDLAGPLVSSVIAELIGIPVEDGKELYRLTELTLHAEGWNDGTAGQALQDIYQYARALWADRLANPTEDLASRLVNGHIGDHKVDETDFDLYFLLLLNAGGDTSRNAISGGVAGLISQPGQVTDLRDNLDEVLPTTVDEMIRWVSPLIYQRRTAKKDTEVGGQAISAGDRVVMFYSAANFDPAEFDRPREFNARRAPNRHVSFGGSGPHLCLGMHLARVEIASMVSALVTRFPEMRLDGEITYNESPIISGPARVPVRLR
jgi:cytochrome P450